MAFPFLLSILLASAPAVGTQQQPEPVALRGAEPLDWQAEGSGIRVVRRERRVVQLIWEPPGAPGKQIDIPMPAPVEDFEVARVPGHGGLVVLAGGVRTEESLDLYLVDAELGFHRFQTDGGRRLPSAFNEGLGSWPHLDGHDVVLFAYERDGRLEFRALDFRGQVLQTRDFGDGTGSWEVTGFDAVSEPKTNTVRVRFAGQGAPLWFPHPRAPRVVLSENLLAFGGQPVGRRTGRQLDLRNEGLRTLHLDLRAEPDDFTVDAPTRRVVPPGGATTLRVSFRPTVSGARVGHLRIDSDAANALVELPLRGEGVMPAAARAAADPVAAPGADTARQAASPPKPLLRPRGLPMPPAPPRVAALRVEQVGPGVISVSGALELAGLAPGAVGLRVRSSSGAMVLVPVAQGGGFAARLPAAPGDALSAVAIGPRGLLSPEREIGRVLPWLSIAGNALAVRGPPQTRYLLAAVALADDGRIQRVLQAWRGAFGVDGKDRLDLGLLGPRTHPIHLVVLLPGDGALALRSNVLRLPPREQ